MSEILQRDTLLAAAFCTAALIALIAMLQSLERSVNTFRIAAYIRVFIEPELPAVQWETRLHQMRKSPERLWQKFFYLWTPKRQIRSAALLNIILYLLIASVTGFIGLNLLRQILHISLVVPVLLIVIVIITLIMALPRFYTVFRCGADYQAHWEKVKRLQIPTPAPSTSPFEGRLAILPLCYLPGRGG